MCIAILSTAHPHYALILLSNRDEYLARPTAPLAQWAPFPETEPHIFSGRDLQRDTHGTWLGITRAGRFAVLTNFREEPSADAPAPDSAIGSRGEIAKTVLTSDPQRPVADVVREMVQGGVQGVGGFSLIFGDAAATAEPSDETLGLTLGLISNRSRADESEGIHWLDGQAAKSIALSNSHYGDRAWPKVVQGEQLLDDLVARSAAKGSGQSKEEFIAEALELLSTDTLPPREKGQDLEVYLRQLRKSIFIPVIGGDIPAQDIAAAKDAKSAQATEHSAAAGMYGTQKQSVVLISKTGEVIFVERTLFDDKIRPVKQDRRFDFEINQGAATSTT